MDIQVKIKDGMNLYETLASKEWRFGRAIAATVAADDRPYAVVLTEHKEFDLAPWCMIESIE